METSGPSQLVGKWEETIEKIEPQSVCNPGGIRYAPTRGQRVTVTSATGSRTEIVQAVPDQYQLHVGQQVFLLADHGRLWVQPVEYSLPPQLRTLPASPLPVSEHESKLHLELSPGWVARPLTDAQRSLGIIYLAENKPLDLATELRAYRRSDVTDLADFATSQQARLASILDNPKSSAITPATLDGRPAIHFEVEGVSRKAPYFGIGYVGIVIQGEVEVAYLVAYTYVAAFPSEKDALAHVADGIRGL
jgi:hypothetical protein